MVQGIDGLRRRLAKVPAKIQAEVAAALEKQADAIVADMRRLAPKGATKRLVESIQWTWGDAPVGTMTLATAGERADGLRITIYAGGGDAFYARFQEFGTVKMPANPFFFPAWRSHRTKVRGAITRAVRKAIKES